MDLDEILKDAVEEFCESKGHSAKLTAKLLALTKRMRQGEVSDTDLGNFLEQILELLPKEGSDGA